MIMQRPTSGPVPVSCIQPFTGLDRSFNAMVLGMVNRCWPRGYSVRMHGADNLSDLKRWNQDYGRIFVSSDHSEHTIFGDQEVNWAFRAWHDWCHLTGDHEFTPEGEYKVSLMQSYHVRRYHGRTMELQWWPLIDAEINGQIEYMARTGQFPTDQVACDLDYIRRVHPNSIYAR